MDAILRLAPYGVIADPLWVELAQISTDVKDRRIKGLLFDEAVSKADGLQTTPIADLAVSCRR